jgi:CheY-like chemotaxis protein
MNQNLMKAVFMKTKHKLVIAENGHKGLKLLSENVYDLVLMDIQMPELDGYETAVIIRKELKSSVPIIAITAHSTLKERERCLSLGMNDYISKPFKKEELLEKIDFWVFGKTDAEIKSENHHKSTLTAIISLDYLKEMAAGDDSFMKEMLQLFEKQSTDNMTLLKESFSEKDLKTVKKIAHKLKSSFSLIGADVLILDIIETEEADEVLAEHIEKLENQLQSIHKEINKILTNT